jgi:hypothetical protein
LTKGAPAEETIAAGTEANMQTDMDTLADTLFPDWPCSIEVKSSSTGDFELVMDNITFEKRVSIQVRYVGADTLTLVAENGTLLDANKLAAPYGGTITVIYAVPITVTVKDFNTGSAISSARVYLTADAGGPETEGDVLLEGITNESGVLTGNYRFSSNQPATGRVRKATGGTYYKTADISGTVTANGLDVTILMIPD